MTLKNMGSIMNCKADFRLDVPSCVTACTNVHCKNEEHKQEIDSMMLDVLHSLEFATDIQTPKPKSVNPNKPAKTTIPAGKPLSNNLHMI